MAPVTVIGGGPAGRFAAMHLAGAGREVRLIERRTLGGQCLSYGCMLINAMNDAARTLMDARRLAALGAVAGDLRVDLPGLLRATAEIQATITCVLGEETTATGVEVLGGVAAGFDGTRAMIDGRPVESEAVIIATGSRPALPPVPGISREGVYTAATLASMKAVPERVAIVGGGVQAAELAYIFTAFGAEVELVVRSGLLPGLDPHLARLARRELDAVRIREGTDLVSVDGGRRVAGVTLSSGGIEEPVQVDAVIAAIGLVPNSEECAGLEKRKNGTIVVDDRMRASVPGVYACGDVTGPPYLTPVARQEGRVAAENVLGCETTMEYRLIPRGFRLGNQYAWAVDDTAVSAYAISGPAGPGSFFAVPERGTGVAKVFLDETGTRVAGVAAAAPDAALSVMYLTELIRHELTVDGLNDFYEIHPAADGLHGLIRYLGERCA
ncbi:MAG: NAD(P)/FAD-dependent oxidoreductase [Methanospirillum sp.]